MEDTNTLQLDPFLQTPEERTLLVSKIVAAADQQTLTNYYLTMLADYILEAVNKEAKKNKQPGEKQKYDLLTNNHMQIVNERETSFEGLIMKFQNGEDGIYNLIANDKNIIFKPKVSITQEDIETIPGMRELRNAIEQVKTQLENATGRRRALLLKQKIELSKDQYVLKKCFHKPIYMVNTIKSATSITLEDHITINPDGSLDVEGTFSLLKPDHVSALLCNYSKLKEDSWGKFNSDIYYTLLDLEHVTDAALEEKYPLYYKLLIYKIDGKSNNEIQSLLFEEFNIKHSVEYISSLWRNKIPKLIAAEAKKEWLEWHYTHEEQGKWKRCSRCGQIKLAHPLFFSKNNTSKDGFYSICKECRNSKNKGGKNS